MKKLILCFSFLLILKGIREESFGQSTVNSKVITENQKIARDIFKQLIEINTTHNNGSARASEAMAARFKKAGFADGDVQIIGPQPQHMNLVVRYCGKGLKPPILFIGHLDVVEALRQDWSMDPFMFTEKDGYFYGRGTSDMKNSDAVMVAILLRFKQENYVPDRDIILALTEDEEGGDSNGVSWLIQNRRDLINAEYCINPDGGGGDMKDGKYLEMTVQTSEKAYCDFRLEVRNKGGHSSLPRKNNAIYHLASALMQLSKYDFPVRLNETTRLYFEHCAKTETGQVRDDILKILNTPVDTAAANRLETYSAYYNAMMRTTCVATMLNGGHARNALPQTAEAIINCRMLPGDSQENVMGTLKSVIADTLVKITCLTVSSGNPLSTLNKDVMNSLETVTSSMWPGVIVMPVMMTGASDGRYLRIAGIPVFGISGCFYDIDDIRAHGKDERVGVKEFFNDLEFTYRFIKSLTSGS